MKKSKNLLSKEELKRLNGGKKKIHLHSGHKGGLVSTTTSVVP